MAEPTSHHQPQTGQVEMARDRPPDAAPGWASYQNLEMALKALLIVVAGWVIYLPALHGDWIGDDRMYFTENVLLQDPARIWEAWFAPGSFIEYYPITESVQWYQWQLWGNETMGYHVTNVVLHLIGALLVWKVLGKFGLRWAWLGGLIFALHPMQVESVASINELKNVLSLPPFLLAVCFYLDYEERKERRDYWCALGLFVVAMLCKISMAAFPAVMLLYAWWKRGRIGWDDVKSSAPFLMVSLFLAAITVWTGREIDLAHPHEPDVIPLGGFGSRMALAGLSLAFYFARCFLPLDPMLMYPQWPVNPPAPWQFLPWLVFALVAAVIWWKRDSWGRHVALALGFFVLNLLPFLGFTNVSYMVSTWVLDHLLYLPIIGMIGLVVAGLGDVDRQIAADSRMVLRVMLALVLSVLALESYGYAGKFTSEEEICTYIVEKNPGAWLAHCSLGYNLMQQGLLPQAIDEFTMANRLYPNHVETHNHLGIILEETGRNGEAEEQFREALRINPRAAESLCNYANILFDEGRTQEALDHLDRALEEEPDLFPARLNLAIALARLGRINEAKKQLQLALQLKPDDAGARQLSEQLQNQKGPPAPTQE